MRERRASVAGAVNYMAVETCLYFLPWRNGARSLLGVVANMIPKLYCNTQKRWRAFLSYRHNSSICFCYRYWFYPSRICTRLLYDKGNVWVP
jgi:hypothetical protein